MHRHNVLLILIRLQVKKQTKECFAQFKIEKGRTRIWTKAVCLQSRFHHCAMGFPKWNIILPFTHRTDQTCLSISCPIPFPNWMFSFWLVHSYKIYLSSHWINAIVISTLNTVIETKNKRARHDPYLLFKSPNSICPLTEQKSIINIE